MKTIFSNHLNFKKFFLCSLLLINIFYLIVSTNASSEAQENTNTKFLEDSSLEKNKLIIEIFEKAFPLKALLENFIKNNIFTNKNFLNLGKSAGKKALKTELAEATSLNITEHTLNSVLLIAQRFFPINLSIKNDTSNLPLAVDTASLSIIIP